MEFTEDGIVVDKPRNELDDLVLDVTGILEAVGLSPILDSHLLTDSVAYPQHSVAPPKALDRTLPAASAHSRRLTRSESLHSTECEPSS